MSFHVSYAVFSISASPMTRSTLSPNRKKAPPSAPAPQRQLKYVPLVEQNGRRRGNYPASNLQISNNGHRSASHNSGFIYCKTRALSAKSLLFPVPHPDSHSIFCLRLKPVSDSPDRLNVLGFCRVKLNLFADLLDMQPSQWRYRRRTPYPRSRGTAHPL